ncbi:hypothetical protein O6H91_07G005300 [Diphasiastrum complanatum]|nr:hypothetical protein O6H91_07G005300 [Diphasiastrum complanatum]
MVAGVLLVSLAAATMAGTTQQLILAWVALALLIGPFAPLSVTGGDCRVGRGELLPPLVLPCEDEKKLVLPASIRNSGSRRPAAAKDENKFISSSSCCSSADVAIPKRLQEEAREQIIAGDDDLGVVMEREDDWAVEEIELLRKQMARIPRGTLRRWHIISEAFGGSRTVENVIAMAKTLAKKKPGHEDSSYSQFLAQRKRSEQIISSPLSRREDSYGALGGSRDTGDQSTIVSRVSSQKIFSNGVSVQQSDEKSKNQWTETEDKALLSALKVFPKDTPMRWEKVAVALPGRSKRQCFKRFSDLRENFRSMKAENNSTALTHEHQLE